MSNLSVQTKLAVIQDAARDVALFQGKFRQYEAGKIPFYVTPEEYRLPKPAVTFLQQVGPALRELFSVLAEIHGLQPHYFFFRPDFLLTETGYKACEVEFSPFGFPLAIFLHNAYNQIREKQGESLWQPDLIKKVADEWKNRLGDSASACIFTDHTWKFKGQFEYLAQQLAPYGVNIAVELWKPEQALPDRPLYRCFYWHERAVRNAWVDRKTGQTKNTFPSDTPYFETKQPLVDFTENPVVKQRLSRQAREILEQALFPTWALRPWRPPASFPVELETWHQLADLPKSQRKFVIKRVGDHPAASWAKSVVFLHKISTLATHQLISTALEEPGAWIIQPFINSEKVSHSYFSPLENQVMSMKGRIRLTPYYSWDTGDWLVGKATIRRDTLIIHGASDSINTLVTWGK